jgi:hypothetical protein
MTTPILQRIVQAEQRDSVAAMVIDRQARAQLYRDPPPTAVFVSVAQERWEPAAARLAAEARRLGLRVEQ